MKRFAPVVLFVLLVAVAASAQESKKGATDCKIQAQFGIPEGSTFMQEWKKLQGQGYAAGWLAKVMVDNNLTIAKIRSGAADRRPYLVLCHSYWRTAPPREIEQQTSRIMAELEKQPPTPEVKKEVIAAKRKKPAKPALASLSNRLAAAESANANLKGENDKLKEKEKTLNEALAVTKKRIAELEEAQRQHEIALLTAQIQGEFWRNWGWVPALVVFIALALFGVAAFYGLRYHRRRLRAVRKENESPLLFTDLTTEQTVVFNRMLKCTICDAVIEKRNIDTHLRSRVHTRALEEAQIT